MGATGSLDIRWANIAQAAMIVNQTCPRLKASCMLQKANVLRLTGGSGQAYPLLKCAPATSTSELWEDNCMSIMPTFLPLLVRHICQLKFVKILWADLPTGCVLHVSFSQISLKLP
eukprot:CAMPEP_0174342836 /NCGR_PEP_ID=MMETSP0810-20121108/26460_1 /TAXON_ID=73025 ORGANISM="Eutreptiella gymnastica-like, Strain CCMP1594" /NCGR_SAMPLE_ID=MMETSP0810 /ASSEMBLY_ACC=CAM_ASM_000659 /LENGTH=115 /DNA_ID=CAMNT_0015465171 /DNA_START=973 /DNA_END=1320 /DNA_ORIENTATION=+